MEKIFLVFNLLNILAILSKLFPALWRALGCLSLDFLKRPDDRWAAGAMDDAKHKNFVVFYPVDNAPGIAEGAPVNFGLCRQFFAFPKGKGIPGDPVDDFIKRVTDFDGI